MNVSNDAVSHQPECELIVSYISLPDSNSVRESMEAAKARALEIYRDDLRAQEEEGRVLEIEFMFVREIDTGRSWVAEEDPMDAEGLLWVEQSNDKE